MNRYQDAYSLGNQACIRTFVITLLIAIHVRNVAAEVLRVLTGPHLKLRVLLVIRHVKVARLRLALLVRHSLLDFYGQGFLKLCLHLSLSGVDLLVDEQLGLRKVLLLELFPHFFDSQLGSGHVLGFLFSLSQLYLEPCLCRLLNPFSLFCLHDLRPYLVSS